MSSEDIVQERSQRLGIERVTTSAFAALLQEEKFADPVNGLMAIGSAELATKSRALFKLTHASVYKSAASRAVVHERIVRAQLAHGSIPSFHPSGLDSELPAELREALAKMHCDVLQAIDELHDVVRAEMDVQAAATGDARVEKARLVDAFSSNGFDTQLVAEIGRMHAGRPHAAVLATLALSDALRAIGMRMAGRRRVRCAAAEVELGAFVFDPIKTDLPVAESATLAQALEEPAISEVFNARAHRGAVENSEPPGQEDDSVRVLKVESEEERTVLGIVLEPGIVDAHNDTYSAEEVRSAAFGFMEQFQKFKVQHKHPTDKVRVLESYLAPVAFKVESTEVREGTWMMRVRVADDELWAGVKSGKLTGFSIGGTAMRRKLSPDQLAALAANP